MYVAPFPAHPYSPPVIDGSNKRMLVACLLCCLTLKPNTRRFIEQPQHKCQILIIELF